MKNPMRAKAIAINWTAKFSDGGFLRVTSVWTGTQLICSTTYFPWVYSSSKWVIFFEVKK